jgi:hypothetical protein
MSTREFLRGSRAASAVTTDPIQASSDPRDMPDPAPTATLSLLKRPPIQAALVRVLVGVSQYHIGMAVANLGNRGVQRDTLEFVSSRFMHVLTHH